MELIDCALPWMFVRDKQKALADAQALLGSTRQDVGEAEQQEKDTIAQVALVQYEVEQLVGALLTVCAG